MHFVSAFAGGQLMADPRLKSPDRWVEYRGECDWVSFFFLFYLLELLLLLFPAVADEINESVEKKTTLKLEII